MIQKKYNSTQLDRGQKNEFPTLHYNYDRLSNTIQLEASGIFKDAGDPKKITHFRAKSKRRIHLGKFRNEDRVLMANLFEIIFSEFTIEILTNE